MKTIALLRGNPKDAAIGKILKTLSNEYMVDCYIWNRDKDFQPAIENGNITYRLCPVRAGFYNVANRLGYYNTAIFLKLILFEIWLFCKLFFAKIDCVHAIDLDTGIVGLCIAKIKRKPFVYHCLDPYHAIFPDRWPKKIGALALRIENMIISKADLFVITDMLRMSQHVGANPKKVIEFANVPMIYAQEKQNRNNSEEFIVGYIGSLVEGRNLATVVDAVGELERKCVKMIIGGYGPISNEIEKLAKKYKNVKFIGFIPYDKVIEIQRTFDLFIYISDPDYESQRWVSPNKLFESMALGKPIIVGEGTLVADRVSDIGNGIVVKYGSKEELQKAILRFKNTPQLIKEMGEKGKSEFEKNWRPEIMEKRLLEAYGELIK